MPGLIDFPAQVWVAVAPVDMRRGLDGLSAIVQQSLGHSPCAGSAFIFRNRAGNRLRLLLWDGNGCGYASAVCIKGLLCGPRLTMSYLRSVRPSGNGWWPVSTGSDYRQNANPIGSSEAVQIDLKILLNPNNIKAWSG